MPIQFKSLVLLGISAILAGCSTNPITGRSQFMVVPEKMAIGESAAAYNSMMGDLGKKKKIEPESDRTKKVREITDRSRARSSFSCPDRPSRSEEHTSELQSHVNLVCRLLLEKKKNTLSFT